MKCCVGKGIELISTIYVPFTLLVAVLSSSHLLLISSSVYLHTSSQVTIGPVASYPCSLLAKYFRIPYLGIRKTKIFLVSYSVALLQNFIPSVLFLLKRQMIVASIGDAHIGCILLGNVLLSEKVRFFEI